MVVMVLLTVLLFAAAYSNAHDANKAAAIIFIFFIVYVFYRLTGLCSAITVP
jgi:hypothetical protein